MYLNINTKMHFQYLGKTSRPFCILFLLIIFFLSFLSYGSTTTAAEDYRSTTIVGVVIDETTRVGKEQKTAMKIAVETSRKSSNHKLTIHFRNVTAGDPLQAATAGDPLQAATAADQLIKVEKVQVLIGSQAWQEVAIVADVGNRAQVPVISLEASAISPTLTHLRWPFLIQMGSNSSKEMESVAAIVHSYNWRKVVVIYEDDSTYGDPGTLAVLTQALTDKGSDIEYRLVLPPHSSLSDPQGFIGGEVDKLLSRKSRVFIILKSSITMATHLFKKAKSIGLMGKDCVWIVTDSITSVLDSSDHSFLMSIKGAIGTKWYYPEETSSSKELRGQFRKIMRLDYPEEDNLVPGVHALRAYDSIMAISQAVTKLYSNENTTSENLLKEILSSDFTGLSGNISFHNRILLDSSNLGIINVVGKGGYSELGYWSSEDGFFKDVDQVHNGTRSMQKLGRVNWPAELDRDPRGWAMPTQSKPMRIGVPANPSFKNFVMFNNSDRLNHSGFCIDVFLEVLNYLETNYYSLPFEFICFNGTYDELVFNVTDQSSKKFDAAVGDITILTNRSKYVEFTQPYAESGLSMTVPYKHEPSQAWLFLNPFSGSMWLATVGMLFYTMFIVWFFEHKSNPDFKGPVKDQLGMAVWFTFSTLFFAHREKVYSNFTKIVVVVWLFVVLVLSSSYTASLSSMLTVQRLEPKVKDIVWLRNTNATVGCDGDSFVKDYLRNVLKLQNIKNISNGTDYPSEFRGNISAAFIELPYQKVFMQDNCNQYTTVGPTYRFGGLGFVFQKGSPIARDVSEAILNISENGVLKGLEKKWFPSSTNCSASTNTGNLTIESFWGIYLISGFTSTVCLILFIAKLLFFGEKKDLNVINQESGDIPAEEGYWRKAIAIVRYVKYIRNNRISPVRAILFTLLLFLL